MTEGLCCYPLTEQYQQCFNSIEEKVEEKLKTLRRLKDGAEMAGLEQEVSDLLPHVASYEYLLSQPLGMWSWACSVPDSPLIWSKSCDCCEPEEGFCKEKGSRPDKEEIWLQYARCCFPVYTRKSWGPVDPDLQGSIDMELQALRPNLQAIQTEGTQLSWGMGGASLARGCLISIHENGTVTSCPESHACHGFDCSYLRAVLMAVRIIQANHPLPAMDFLLNAGDETTENTLPQAPVFTRTGTRWTATLALPFEWQLHPAQCVRKLKEGMLATQRRKWEDREAILIWRGSHSNLWLPDCRVARAANDEEFMARCAKSVTGAMRDSVWNFSTWLQLPRGRLVWLSKFASFIDAKFVESTTLPPMSLDLESFLRDEGLFAPRMDGWEFEEYKYQIAIEGNCATDRLSWQLFMGSVVLIPDQPWQWMSPFNMLQPWVHFVPVA